MILFLYRKLYIFVTRNRWKDVDLSLRMFSGNFPFGGLILFCYPVMSDWHARKRLMPVAGILGMICVAALFFIPAWNYKKIGSQRQERDINVTMSNYTKFCLWKPKNHFIQQSVEMGLCHLAECYMIIILIRLICRARLASSAKAYSL